MSPDLLRDTIAAAFLHLYPDLDRSTVHVDLRDDETIVVTPADCPQYRATIHSDDDGYLRFTMFDEDDAPEDDDHDFVSIHVALPKEL